jgi:hypothetical protein
MKLPAFFKRKFYLFMMVGILFCLRIFGQDHKDILLLNGTVDFGQTEYAFPPAEFRHKIQVPGLVDLAEPEVDQREKYFTGTQKLKYHWYRFVFKVPSKFENKFATLTLLKSMFNTQIILNGYDCGTYMQCSTPVEADLTPYLKFNEQDNILLIRVGEEKRLPKETALGFDREKFGYIPGIWDDIFISFTGPVRIARSLILTSYVNKEITVKLKVENVSKILQRNMEMAFAVYTIKGYVREKISGKRITPDFVIQGKTRSQLESIHEIKVPIQDPVAWSPENPFLYQVVLTAITDSIVIDNYGNPELKKVKYPEFLFGTSDLVIENIGMKDFTAAGQFFSLNGERYFLAGTSITLFRFFEDPDRKSLPWDKKWVEEMFIRIPKKMGWNACRVCIGLLPEFWYDLADEYGIMLQNEYPMWQLRGSDSQMEKEYTDWVWSDGTHPSIAIWDALNEQKSDFIGNRLIPGLLKLDPSRIWDAGYMTAADMKIQMAESHPYELGFGWWDTDEDVNKRRNTYSFGALTPGKQPNPTNYPVLVNEYGWIWQTRDGKESAIRVKGEFLKDQITPYTDNYEYFEPGGEVLYRGRDIYEHFLGKDATSEDRWRFEAYYLGIQTEKLRARKSYAGILSFVYLTNNRGYTGDWFMGNVADLNPGQGLMVQYHNFKRFAVFIDHEDQRYNKNGGYIEPGISKNINLVACSETRENKAGKITVKLINSTGKTVLTRNADVQVPPFGTVMVPVNIKFPKTKGGFLLLTELTDLSEKQPAMKQVSIRYLKIENIENPVYYNYKYSMPE